MNQAHTFKCPSCGAYLEYDPGCERMNCPYCHTEIDVRAVIAPEKRDGGMSSTGGMREYHCQNCGAQIVTGDTTAATRCYYCHSPVVLTDRLSEAFYPDGVIPFTIDETRARKQFDDFLAGKMFVDRRFFTHDQLEHFSGVYYPYWYGDLTGVGNFDGKGTRISVVRGSKETVTTTRYYQVKRKARMVFANMFRKALAANDRKLSDGIFPYDTGAMQPFSSAYLSGFLAERRDVESKDAAQDMEQEVRASVKQVLCKQSGYDSLSGQASFTLEKANMRYVLLPTWVLTYRGDKPGKTYFYMMNGQKGTVCGRLPVNKPKLWLWACAAGALVTGLMCLGGALLW